MSDKELDFNTLVRLTSEKDKDITLSVGVYNGSTSFTVFKKGERGPALKISAPLAGRVVLIDKLNKVLANGNESQEKQEVHKWDPDNKKTVLQGTVVFGRDDKGLVYMGVSGPNFNGTRFPFRIGMLYGADAAMTDLKKSEYGAKEFAKILDDKCMLAETLTSFKRDFNGGGNNRSGSGSGGGRSNESSGDMF